MTVHGNGGHATMPDTTIDPNMIASDLVGAQQTWHRAQPYRLSQWWCQ
jgi:metal-dependent amidase/aminoacylase/carboxypeptidase family protein